jgi:hypothetical protein
MIAIIKRNTFPAVLAVLVVFTVVPFIDSVQKLSERTKSAIVWIGAKSTTPVVRPGEILTAIYTARINKTCPSDVRSFLVGADGSVPVRFPTAAGGYARPAKDPVTITVNVPIPMEPDRGLAPLKPGPYTYRTMATRYCPDGVEDDNNVPDVKFTLNMD